MEPSGRNRWQPTATVSHRMVRVDHLLAKEGVTFLAPQRETSPANPKVRRTRLVTLLPRERKRRRSVGYAVTGVGVGRMEPPAVPVGGSVPPMSSRNGG